MSPYFIAITFINLFTLLMLSVGVKTNTVINSTQKKDLLITNTIIFVICIMEVLTLIFDGSPIQYKWIHYVSNYLGFSLTPAVFLCLGNALFPNNKFSWLLMLSTLYSLWMLFSLISGNGNSVFYIDEFNNYSRGKGFFVYTIFYIIGLVYFFIENIRLSIKFWHSNSLILLLNFLFIMGGTTIQILHPQIQVTWLCVVISIVIYYIYHNSLYEQLDSQTYFMNYNSFQKQVESQKKEVVIVIAEIDNYSKLKLNYNRSQLDEIILNVSREFNYYFKKYGRCYRIGSEEFCVIISNKLLNFDELIKEFFIKYVGANYKMQEMPLISLGYATKYPKQDINQVLTAADIKKRDFIKERINLLY